MPHDADDPSTPTPIGDPSSPRTERVVIGGAQPSTSPPAAADVEPPATEAVPVVRQRFDTPVLGSTTGEQPRITTGGLPVVSSEGGAQSPTSEWTGSLTGVLASTPVAEAPRNTSPNPWRGKGFAQRHHAPSAANTEVVTTVEATQAAAPALTEPIASPVAASHEPLSGPAPDVPVADASVRDDDRPAATPGTDTSAVPETEPQNDLAGVSTAGSVLDATAPPADAHPAVPVDLPSPPTTHVPDEPQPAPASSPSQDLVVRPRAEVVPVYPKRRSLPQYRRARQRGRIRRRTVWVLVLSQIFGALGATIGVAVASLLAKDVSGSERLAGSAQTMQAVGSAVGALVIAKLAMRHGRRFSLATGYLIGALGSGLCVVSGALMNFPLLLTGAMMLGAATAAGMQARFAATDLAEPQHRGRDLSTVVWSSTIGAVLGPNLVTVGEQVARSWSLPPLTGPFVLAALGLALAGGSVLVFLRPDPMQTAAAWKRDDERIQAEGEPFSGSIPVVKDVALRNDAVPAPKVSAWTVIRSNPVVLAAVIANALNQAVMVSVMIMTPVHMHHGHADMAMIGFTISLHMVGMFAFSPAFGWLTDKLGAIPVLILGATTNLMAVLMTASSPEGHSLVLMGGLHVLGVGWSLTIISASTLLTSATAQEHRPLVQGWCDLATGFAAALGGLLAGEIVAQASYGTLSLLCIPAVIALYLCALAASRFRRVHDAAPLVDASAR